MTITLDALVAKEKPESVKKFYDKDKFIGKILDTTEGEHSTVYTMMKNKFLRGKDGKIDYDLLDDAGLQKKVIDFMANEYLDRAQKYLGATKPENDVEKDMILQRYFGINRGFLRRQVKELGSGYTQKAHEGLRDKHMKRLRGELLPLAQSHFTEDDLEHVVKYIGAEDMLDIDRLKSTPTDAGNFLRLHRQGKGKVSYERVAQNEDLVGYIKDAYHKIDPAKDKKKKN